MSHTEENGSAAPDHERAVVENDDKPLHNAAVSVGEELEFPQRKHAVTNWPDTSHNEENAPEEYDKGEEELGERSDALPRTPSPASSIADTGSIPDDTPSLRGSRASTPLLATPSSRGSVSRTPSSTIRPFGRRLQSRFSMSPSPSRATTPIFLSAHSRQSSLSSQIFRTNGDHAELEQTPWEVIKWSRLRKLSGQCFSEIGKRQLGTPTCLAVSNAIIIGTSKGLVLIFDYHQNLKSIVGQGTKAMESGSVTSLAISADYSTIAAGHLGGAIFTWEIAHPAKPFLTIPALSQASRQAGADGHVADRSVLHVAFLGTRHTALVSADEGGMAFSHLATRGLGAMGRSVKTTRLLGRYPALDPTDDINRKPSSVLAFAALPLGNVEQATDLMGLTALLTPYLLVVVSTTPIAQTQHKSSRPKDMTVHGPISGCLAWFPSVKLRTPVAGHNMSSNKLVYCWSDLLTILEIDIGVVDPDDNDKQPSLSFRHRSRWKCEETIVAVQWLSRSVIGVLTISQRLVILEDGPELQVMDSVDLLQRQIYHRDFFSSHLKVVMEHDEADSEIQGVIADAYYMSFKAYKGRLFLMSFSDVSVGTLSNWADRLTALVEHGDDIGAIRLGITYYQGGVGQVSVGLPEDKQTRQELVGPRVLELLTASLRHRLSESSVEDDRLHELTTECFRASLIMNQIDFVLDDAYEFYRDGHETEIFIDTLESHILENEIHSLPPILVKDVVNYYTTTLRDVRLEELLCRLDARTFDIDQVTRLCKEHFLYDALIYVWNEALADWVTPLLELLTLVRQIQDDKNGQQNEHEDRLDAAQKVFTYLAFSLTGRRYPAGQNMDETVADGVRHDLYKTLFSSGQTSNPGGRQDTNGTKDGSNDFTPAFPYLDLLLHFDTQDFMSMINEAFEDAYLNTPQEADHDGSFVGNNGAYGRMTRQQIVSILLQVMSNDTFTHTETLLLDMFVARSLPKYPQFLILSGSELRSLLERLCACADTDLAEECQLSVEYLFSVYQPAITQDIIDLLREAGFTHILQSIYRKEGRWIEYVQLLVQDQDQGQNIFVGLNDALKATGGTGSRASIEEIVQSHASMLAIRDLGHTVHLVQQHLLDKIDLFVAALKESRLQFAFLRELLESGDVDIHISNLQLSKDDSKLSRLTEQYVQLMCLHNPDHVSDYISTLESANLHLDIILPELEHRGLVDAAVRVLAKADLAEEAMSRLVKHLLFMRAALCRMLGSIDKGSMAESVDTSDELIQQIVKYGQLGIWLCHAQTRASASAEQKRTPLRRQNVKEDDLDADELSWLELVDATVQVSQSVHVAAEHLSSDTISHTTTPLRALVQQIFTVLLTSTNSNEHQRPDMSEGTRSKRSSSFIRIFTLFLARAAASSHSLSDLRGVLQDIFSTYAYEADMLKLSSQLLDRDAFDEIRAVHEKRLTGWRPRQQVCEACKLRVCGHGAGEAVWDAWVDAETTRSRDAVRRQEKRVAQVWQSEGQRKGKERTVAQEVETDPLVMAERKWLEVVVFACRHVYHRHCLDGITAQREDRHHFECPLCRDSEAMVQAIAE